MSYEGADVKGKLPAVKVLPLFGSGGPLCWCGASAESREGSSRKGNPTYPTLCRLHWQGEKELTALALARADRRLKELEGD